MSAMSFIFNGEEKNKKDCEVSRLIWTINVESYIACLNLIVNLDSILVVETIVHFLFQYFPFIIL